MDQFWTGCFCPASALSKLQYAAPWRRWRRHSAGTDWLSTLGVSASVESMAMRAHGLPGFGFYAGYTASGGQFFLLRTR